jgi:hypothetical protein
MADGRDRKPTRREDGNLLVVDGSGAVDNAAIVTMNKCRAMNDVA